jgi:hypothetical protein
MNSLENVSIVVASIASFLSYKAQTWIQPSIF